MEGDIRLDICFCLDCKCVCTSDKMGKEYLQCDACFRIFKSRKCFHNHLVLGKSKLFSAKTAVCDNLVACRTCGRDLKAKHGVSTGKKCLY